MSPDPNRQRDASGKTAPAGIEIAPAGPEHAEEIVEITREAFDGVSIDQVIERLFGPAGGLSWRDVKGGVVAEQLRDGQCHFVALAGGEVVGYATTLLEPHIGRGRIRHLAVRKDHRGRGVGRLLIRRCLDHFRAAGLSVARIEALAINAASCHLYPACGFTEITREVHFAMRL